MDIINGLDSEGYFEENIEERVRILGVESEVYEKVYKCFSYFNFVGIGVRDVKESFLF